MQDFGLTHRMPLTRAVSLGKLLNLDSKSSSVKWAGLSEWEGDRCNAVLCEMPDSGP